METLKSLLQELWNQLKPPQAFSWQTLIWLSVFSWFLSLLTVTALVEEGLAWMGWFFLTIGIAWGLWGTTLNLLGWKLRPGPWVAGAMVCLLLFRGVEENEALPLPLALTLWPIVSAAIAILPRLFPNLSFKIPEPPVQRDLMTLFLVSLLLSCWFRFYYLIDNWLLAYPSIVSDDLSRSGFVVRLDDGAALPDPRGVALLNELNQLLQQRLQGKPWREAERWLFERDKNIQNFEAKVHRDENRLEEDVFWRFQSQVPPQQSRDTEYTLNLWAFWSGPAAQPGGYYVQQTCQVQQVANPALLRQGADPQTALADPVTRLECGPIEKNNPTDNPTGGVG